MWQTKVTPTSLQTHVRFPFLRRISYNTFNSNSLNVLIKQGRTCKATWNTGHIIFLHVRHYLFLDWALLSLLIMQYYTALWQTDLFSWLFPEKCKTKTHWRQASITMVWVQLESIWLFRPSNYWEATQTVPQEDTIVIANKHII